MINTQTHFSNVWPLEVIDSSNWNFQPMAISLVSHQWWKWKLFSMGTQAVFLLNKLDVTGAGKSQASS